LYFENKNQAEQLEEEKFFSGLSTFDEMNSEDLDARLQNDPQFLFVEPVGNTENMPSVDLVKIIKSPTSHDRRIIIIDNTLCGTNLDTKKILENLDDNTVVLLISSLQKLYEEGDDVASAGMITLLSKNDAVTSQVYKKIKALRGMLGTNITPYHLKLIQKIDPPMIKEHIHKIGVNVAELSSFMQGLQSSVLEKVVTSDIENGVSQAAVFYVHFNKEIGHDFINKILNKSTKRNLQVVYGASFGFKNTRMAVIEDPHQVRICPGIENPREIAVLKEIIEESLRELDRVLEE
jgi:hypothetical protein